jgi:deoxycytidylate deaminase
MILQPYLPPGKAIRYVASDNPFMKLAREASLRDSTDFMQPTGAVVEKDQVVLLTSSNQSAIKNKWLLKLHQSGLCVRKIFGVKSGTKYWLCPGCATASLHAESRAATIAKKNNINIKGANLYLWGHWWCCKPCWDAMISGGIDQVYLAEGADDLFRRESPHNILGRKSDK